MHHQRVGPIQHTHTQPFTSDGSTHPLFVPFYAACHRDPKTVSAPESGCEQDQRQSCFPASRGKHEDGFISYGGGAYNKLIGSPLILPSQYDRLISSQTHCVGHEIYPKINASKSPRPRANRVMRNTIARATGPAGPLSRSHKVSRSETIRNKAWMVTARCVYSYRYAQNGLRNIKSHFPVDRHQRRSIADLGFVSGGHLISCRLIA